MAESPKVWLVDASYHAFRALHAWSRMQAGGRPTGAIYGLAHVLTQIEKRWQPTHGAVVFERGLSPRTAIWADYVGHRPARPPELAAQWPVLMELARAWGWRVLDVETQDGDDVIATVARHLDAAGAHPRIVTGDRPFAQLVTERTHLVDVYKHQVLGPAEVEAAYGLPPDRVAHALALAGNSSHGVPGVPGLGLKTAAKLIAQYGDLDGVLRAAAEGAIKGKRGAVLVEHAEAARTSLELVTLREVDVPAEWTEVAFYARRPIDTAALRELLARWQLGQFVEWLDGYEQATGAREEEAAAGAAAVAAARLAQIERTAYRAIYTRLQLRQAVEAIAQRGRVSVDLETTSLDPLEAEIVGISLCWDDWGAVYVPVGHRYGGARDPRQLDVAVVREVLEPVLADARIAKTGQNLKYDLEVFRANGWSFEGIAGDTMLADWLLEPDHPQHGLDDLAARHLGHANIRYATVTGGKPDEVSFADVPLDEATPYAAEDAHIAWLLDRVLTERLEAADLLGVYRDIEVPLVEVLASMELAGIAVDVAGLRALADELAARIAEAEAEVFRLAGHPFAIHSTPQLRKVLFEERGLKPRKRTRGGLPSTDAETLEALAAVDPLPRAILRYRELTKLKSTYVDALPRAVSARTGRIHTSFKQTGTATGRLASADPNLQNIPVRTEEGRRIRACFVAPPGRVLISSDYSQIELRVLAHLCGKGALLEAFLHGEDIHRRTAAEVFGVAPEAVTPEQRRAAKAINFGIIYGMSATRLARELGLAVKEARALLDRYFERYPEVDHTRQRIIDDARARGYARTLCGRRRFVPGIRSANQRERSAAERVAVNSTVQGSAADIIKIAMIRVHRALAARGDGARLLLQVHDELLVEAPQETARDVARLVAREMEAAYELRVPLVADTGLGANWAEAH